MKFNEQLLFNIRVAHYYMEDFLKITIIHVSAIVLKYNSCLLPQHA